MKYLDEFRNGEVARKIAREIRTITRGRWRIMEVCGGQTHSIIRNGIDQILPDSIELVHGPGCPVCVTPIEMIDRAIGIASIPGVIFCSFGDMIRVPGSREDLFSAKARGADIRIVYSPLDAVAIARKNPEKQVVFFAIGFETTAPANAIAISQAKAGNIGNFSVLVSHVLVPPALSAIMESPDSLIDGFLAAGHVCSVMGYRQYESLADKYKVPIVITGFEPLDVLEGIRRVVFQLENGMSYVENAYQRVVTRDGNRIAQKLLEEVFEPADRVWRGIGPIPSSGWQLTQPFRKWDANTRFSLETIESEESCNCRAGDILRGAIKPSQCAAFGKACTPRTPLGAPMVSNEGACAAYFNYGRIFPQ
jgi:hydrogenase expression/formation protein HypD